MILTTEQLQTANTYVSNKDFVKALETLRLIDIDTSSDLMGDYYLLLSEASLSLGELEQDYAEQAVLFFLKTSEHKKYALAKYLLGWQIQLLGNYANAKEPLNEAYSASLRCDDQFLSARILNRLSYVLFKSGDIDQTIKVLNKTKTIYTALNLSLNILKANINLAHIYFSCGKIKHALKTYNLLLESPAFNPNLNSSAILSLSLSYALRGDRQKALKLIRSKGNEFSESQRQQSIYHEYYGQILMLDRQLKESLSQLHTGLELSLKMAPESDMISQIERLLGDAYLLLGDYTKSEAHTKKSLQVAEKINEKVEIAACYRIFAQLEYQKGNNDNAKDWFKKSIDMFRLINSNYELAVTRYLAASTTLYVNGEKSSMLYLAQEYFESENITHYVHKVQKELQKNNGRLVKGSQSAVAGFYPTNINSRIQCPDIIAVNKKMVKILDHTKNIASSEMSILLTGETGTGKEIMARYIHYHSGRNDNFVAVNSSAFPNEMFESELFGYKKGAFTGAKNDKPGLFELAEGGTFFLDEIGDINLDSQVKLLRVLDQKSYRRLGENKTRSLNFRLISATNRNLEQMIKDNLFRPDLYFRLKEIAIHLPPLRDRNGDVLALVEYFLQDLGHKINGDAKIVEQLATLLSERQWDGNIRELRNELKRLYLFADKSIEKMIELAEIKQPLSESKQLLKLLEKTDWNQSEVARILNVSETTIRRRIKKYNILQSKYSIY